MESAFLKIGLLAGLTALTASCSPADNEPGPGGVTAGEARALDDAAQMLDSRRVNLDDLKPSVQAAPNRAKTQAPAPNPAK